MARRSDHSRDEIREMALKAAVELVETDGFQALSTRKVASAIGYTVGTLYLVYKNLAELVLSINAETLDLIYQEMLDEIEKQAEDEEVDLGVARGYLQYALKHPQRFRMVYEHPAMTGVERPLWYQQKLARNFSLAEESLRKLAPDKDDAYIQLSAKGMWCGIHGMTVLALSQRLEVVGLDQSRDLHQVYMRNYIKGFVN